MDEEKYRSAAKALRRLASLESLSRAGAEEMRDLLSGVCGHISQESGGESLALLESDNPRSGSGDWSIQFRQRSLLDFELRSGPATAIPSAVSKCIIRRPQNGRDVIAFHYLKVNDHGVWHLVGDDDIAPIDAGMIADLITEAINEKLTLYPPPKQ